MRKFIALYFKLLCVVITAVVGALLFPVTLQVVSRYTDLIPTWLWTEEAARFLLVWMVMLGATIAVRMRGHFDIDLLPEPKSPRGKLFARLLVDVADVHVGAHHPGPAGGGEGLLYLAAPRPERRLAEWRAARLPRAVVARRPAAAG